MRNFYFCFILLITHGLSAQTVEVVATGINKPVSLLLTGDSLLVGGGATNSGSGIRVLDLSDDILITPTTLTTSGSIWGMLKDGNQLYYSDVAGDIVGVFDLSTDPPTSTTIAQNLAQPEGLLKIGQTLYIGANGSGASSSQGVHKVDLSESFPQNSERLFTDAASGLILYNEEIYFSNFNGSQIKKFDPNAAMPTAEVVISGLSGPEGLALNGSFLYISEYNGGRITRVDLNDPDLTKTTLLSGLINPTLVEFDGTTLYFGEYDANRVSRVVINEPQFSVQAAVCAGALATRGGASPTGGVYSGNGVTDDGNGTTYTFDPVAAGGVGDYQVTYTISSISTSTTVSVVDVPSVGLAPPAVTTVSLDDGVQTGLGGGTPVGGVYSGNGVTDNGNGMTYSFDPETASLGAQTVTYTYLDDNGCGGTDSAIITVSMGATAPGNDACTGATDINPLFGQVQGEPQTSTAYTNSDATTGDDPDVPFANCFFESDPLQQTVYFAFTGDGETYNLRAVDCGLDNYLGDTQVALYTGDCEASSFVSCNDDEDGGNSVLNFQLEVATQAGTPYLILVDGYNGGAGEFCLEVTRMTNTAIVDTQDAGIEIFPNPTSGLVELRHVKADQVDIYNAVGQLVRTVRQPGATLDLGTAATGVYVLKITAGEAVYTTRLVRE